MNDQKSRDDDQMEQLERLREEVGGGVDGLEKMMNHRLTPQGLIDHQRLMALGTDGGKGGLYYHFVHALDSRLKAFFAENPTEKKFPAVDLASGAAVYPVMLGFRYLQPVYPATLQWYPTEWGGDGRSYLETETRPAIKILAKEVADAYPLFKDGNGHVVQPKDMVSLDGLSMKELNGLRGIIAGKDPESKGHYVVQVEDQDKPLSLKAENLCTLETMGSRGLEHMSQKILILKRQDKAFFDALLARTREVDVLNHETWSNVAGQYGKCALVTCTILLNSMGYRAPQAWQNVLELASTLLRPGGLLLTYDTEKWGGYANTPEMEAYIKTNALGLVLDERSEPTSWDDDDGRMFLLIWKKVGAS
jgi:hypothetical protein